MNNQSSMIRFSQVSKRYGAGHSALLNVSFDLAAGEMVFLTGHSGAGKSTLLKLIARIDQPSSGEIVIDGLNLARLSSRLVPFHRRKVGLIFQDAQLLPERSILENVMLPLIIAGFRPEEVDKRAKAALEKVGLLPQGNQLPETLSVGEQQRVGIARAIVARPPIIIADEPTGNLDPELSKEIMQMFSRLNQLGTTIIIATHDLAVIDDMPFRHLHLKQGQLTDSGVLS